MLATHRCDLTLVCSPVELALLRDTYGVPAAKLALAPFFVPPPPPAAELLSHGACRHFVSIGNFKHPPNMDSVRRICREQACEGTAKIGALETAQRVCAAP